MYRRRGTGPQILIRGTYALKWWVISSTLRSIYPCVAIIGQEAGWVTESVPTKWWREKSLSHPGIDPQSQDHSQSFHLLRYLHSQRHSFTIFYTVCFKVSTKGQRSSAAWTLHSLVRNSFHTMIMSLYECIMSLCRYVPCVAMHCFQVLPTASNRHCFKIKHKLTRVARLVSARHGKDNPKWI
jgi:hypothetical protein